MKTDFASSQSNRIAILYQHLSLWFAACSLIIRLFLPGFAVDMGENSVLWLFISGAFVFMILHAQNHAVSYFQSPGFIILLLMGMVWSFASAIWASDYIQSLYQSMIWFSDILLFFTLCYWARDKETRSQILALLLSLLVVEMLYGVYQYFIGLPATRAWVVQNPDAVKQLDIPSHVMDYFRIRLKIDHIFGHFPLTNSLGGYLILYIPLLWVLSCSFIRENTIAFLAFLFLFLFSLAVLALTASRGSVLSLMLASIAGILCWSYHTLPRKKMAILTTLVVVVSTIFAILSTQTHLLDFIGTYSLSMVMRLAYSASACQVFCHNPWFGVGVNNFRCHYYVYKYPWAEEVNKVHNCYLQWVVETGIFGVILLACFVGMVVLFIFRINKRKKYEKESIEDRENAEAHENVPIQKNGGSKKNGHPMDGKNTLSAEVAPHPGSEVSAPQTYDSLWRWLFPCAAAFSFFVLWMAEHSFEFESTALWISEKMGYKETITDFSLFCAYLLAGAGVAIWFLSFAWFSRLTWNPKVTLGLSLGLLGFAIHNLLDIDFYEPGLSQTFWAILALILSQTECRKGYRIPRWLKLIFLISLLLATIWLALKLVPDLMKWGYLRASIMNLKVKLSEPIEPLRYRMLTKVYANQLYEAAQIAPWDDRINAAQAALIFQHIQDMAKRNNVEGELEFLFAKTQECLDRTILYQTHSSSACFTRAQFFFEQAFIWENIGEKKKSQIALKNAQKDMGDALKLYPYNSRYLIFAGKLEELLKAPQNALAYYKKALYVNDMRQDDLTSEEKDALIKKIVRCMEANK